MVQPPYGTVVRLLWAATEHWEVLDGRYAAGGIDPFSLPLTRLLNLLYFSFIENLSKEDRQRFDTELLQPLPGARVTAEAVEMEMEMFRRAQAIAR